MLDRIVRKLRRSSPDETPFLEAIDERRVVNERSQRILESFRSAQRVLERRHVNTGHTPERRGA